MAYSAGDIQVGYGVESVFGTAVAPTKFFEITSESLKQTIDRTDSKGLRTQRVLASKANWSPGKIDAGGDIEFEWQTKGMGRLLGHLLGDTVSTTGTTSYTHVYEMTAGETTNGKSMTWQVGRTDASGNRARFIYAGAKATSWEISAAAGEIVMGKVSLDAQSETVDATAPATATYPTGVPLVFQGAAVNVDGTSFTCKNVSIKGDNALKTDRYNLGSNLKKEQVQNGLRSITGQIGLEFDGLTAYNYVVNGSVKSFSAVFSSLDAIDGSVKASLTISLPDIRFDGETPVANNGQIIDHNLNFVALDDETGSASPCVITYVTLDATP